MKLSRKTDYALRAIFTLVDRYGGEPVSIRELAELNRIPKRFLEQIMLAMKSKGWVDSRPGKSGGYVLARPPDTLTMGQIVRHFDGLLAPIGCVSLNRYEPCTQESVCKFRRVLLDARNAVARLMDEATLAAVHRSEIVRPQEVQQAGSFLGGDGI